MPHIMESGQFRFGLFEFSVATRELRRDGIPIHLQQQPALVLACLIEHAGQVVSRDQLRRTLWGGETFVDFDRGLNFCVSQIRSALKDDPARPAYIRTIPKQGYQFIASVEPPAPRGARARTIVLACAGAILVVLAIMAGFPRLTHPPVVAVLRFDNETGNPAMTRFSDGLTDTVVEQLTAHSAGRYRVIGNALILRGPRETRDLSAIAKSLHAGYVVLGQVQSDGAQIRILAHLIRLPEQTHVWVVRADRTLAEPLSVTSEVAGTIAAQFAPRVSQPFITH